MKIAFVDISFLDGTTSMDPFNNWNNTIYINKRLSTIGKIIIFFHELFHWSLTWIEWCKGDYVFPTVIHDFWDSLWSLDFREALRELKEALYC